MRGFGSDGASVMTGRKNGVSALFRKEIKNLVSVHCICHRLALSGKDASEKIPFINEFFHTID